MVSDERLFVSVPTALNNQGLNAASAAMMDPNFMKDAMEMMKDPAVMKQVRYTKRRDRPGLYTL